MATLTLAQNPVVVNNPAVYFNSYLVQAELGDKVILEPHIDGEGPFEYFWFKNGELLSNANLEYLPIESFANSDTAYYQINVVNSYGEALSEPLELLHVGNKISGSLLPAFNRLAFNSFRLFFSTNINTEYYFQYSYDLINWTSVRGFRATKRETFFDIKNQFNLKFYRVVKSNLTDNP